MRKLTDYGLVILAILLGICPYLLGALCAFFFYAFNAGMDDTLKVVVSAAVRLKRNST